MIKDVTEVRTVKKGYEQGYLVSGNYEILLNDIKKGTDLDAHSHYHSQLVYCFKGEFDFYIKGKSHRIVPELSLIVNSQVIHAADALADFRSLDVKYIPTPEELSKVDFVVRFNVFSEKIANELLVVEEVVLNEIELKRIRNKKEGTKLDVPQDLRKKRYFVTGKRCKVTVNGREYDLQPMRIYLVEDEGFRLVLQEENSELFMFEI